MGDTEGSTPNVTCVAAAANGDGVLYALVVVTDWEAFQSFLYRITELGTEKKDELIYETDGWATSMWLSENGGLFLADDDGQIHSNVGGRWSVVSLEPPGSLTYIYGLSEAEIYSCGKNGALYRFADSNWSRIDAGTEADLYGIHCEKSGEAYAVGERGTLLRWSDLGGVELIEVPTNAMLNAVLSVEGNVVVCGERGVVLSGSGNQWAVVEADAARSFHSATRYGTDVLLGAGADGVFRLRGSELVAYKEGVPAYGLASNEGFLAVSGNEIAFRFDGAAWIGKKYNA